MMKLNLLLLSGAALFNSATALDNGRAVELGSAGDYAILAKTGISSVPDSSINGHIAVSPIAATAITGFSLTKASSDDFSTSTQVNNEGKAFAPEYSEDVKTALITAVGDMQTAYDDAAGRDVDDDEPEGGQTYNELETGDIGGQILKPGVYTFTSAIRINADITLQGTKDNADVFIIRTTKSLLQAASTEVKLVDVAPENVFWQVAEQVEVGASAVLNGIVLVETDALFKDSSTLNGRVLAQTACNLKVATIVTP
jgi:hypothetical protein